MEPQNALILCFGSTQNTKGRNFLRIIHKVQDSLLTNHRAFFGCYKINDVCKIFSLVHFRHRNETLTQKIHYLIVGCMSDSSD